MINKVEITIDIIIHATEDITKIFRALEILDLKKDKFTVHETSGYFDDPITILNIKIVKKNRPKNF